LAVAVSVPSSPSLQKRKHAIHHDDVRFNSDHAHHNHNNNKQPNIDITKQGHTSTSNNITATPPSTCAILAVGTNARIGSSNGSKDTGKLTDGLFRTLRPLAISHTATQDFHSDRAVCVCASVSFLF